MDETGLPAVTFLTRNHSPLPNSRPEHTSSLKFFPFMLNVLEVRQLMIADLTQIIFIGAPEKKEIKV